ncbi:MAG: FKBP-type peptidyl-prolyl cis-trans isomerase [Tannerella sp.]|jgi:FKBP-type peptidyl-prolyl cis-trans isomerase FkpA/FKBP-type peptidyl-prolyl cis-trans isomerase FklB|nr:FKBP-type peptidyl-prolyl cis-trans isomerase [Tannerella sp.]
MKKIFALFFFGVIIAAPLAAQQKTDSGIVLKSPLDSASYAVGINWGSGMLESLKGFPGPEPNLNALAEGIRHALSGLTESWMNVDQAQAYLQSYLTEVSNQYAAIAKEAETKFLAENKTKPGVITTESGLQYQVLVQGEGDKPSITDNVTVHYTGKLPDGTVFDSSEQRGEPLTIGIGQVIRGWTEALLLMPLGSRYMAWIPSELAYGEKGFQAIKPNTTLIFEMELLGIEAVNAQIPVIQE